MGVGSLGLEVLSDRIWPWWDIQIYPPPQPRMLARHHQNDSEFLVGELPPQKVHSHWHLGWGGRSRIFVAQKETHLKTNMATLPETNSSHLPGSLSPKGNYRLPTIRFSGANS